MDNKAAHAKGGKEGYLTPLRRIEKREWWLWATAVVITLLLTGGILSFLPSFAPAPENQDSFFRLRGAMWGLLGLVLLFDLYTVYQQLQIHRIRRQLYEREELFRLISENAADLIAVVDMDGNRIYNSLSYQRVLGYSPEELKNSAPFAEIHPDDRERVRAASAEARQTGIGKALEYRIRGKNGTWHVLESTASVIRNTTGEAEKLVVVNRDITERVKAAESLRQSEFSFRSMVETAPYGIFRMASDGRLLQANPALQRILGYDDLRELLTVDLRLDLFAKAEDFATWKALFDAAQEFRDVEVQLKRKDGTPIIVLCSGRRVQAAESASSCFDIFAEDVTERRVLERQLRMAGKMEAVGRLSGGIAHDFNNLLGVIIGYSEVFKRKLEPTSPLFEYAQEIEKAGQRAASLTRQLLAFSRQQILTPAILNLNDLVVDMAKMLPRLLGEDIVVSTSLPSDLNAVKADKSQVEQVILNLAVNARDAMPGGGTLKIETANVQLDQAYARQHPGARPGRYVMLAVIDSGTGIDAETLTHIFEPFFTTKEPGKGTGLGLATVYGVVKQSEGYVAVESEVGKGTAFRIFLPRVDGRAVQDAGKPTQAPASRGSETILLVEDADSLRKLTQSILESHGYQVLAAREGTEAMWIEEQHPGTIHLLLTDVVMPGMNGKVLADRLLPKRPNMKVLYVSGYTDSFVAQHGVLEQGMALLHKPFGEADLVKKVRHVLDSDFGPAPQEALRDLTDSQGKSSS